MTGELIGIAQISYENVFVGGTNLTDRKIGYTCIYIKFRHILSSVLTYSRAHCTYIYLFSIIEKLGIFSC